MITSDFAGNAVYAKVKGLYGKRLKHKEYSELLSLRSVHEIAEYLKTKTSYSEIFEGLTPPGEWQRSQLENLLFNKLYNDLQSIIRFQKAAGSSLYEYFIMKYDTAQLINVLSSLETESNDYIFTFPVFYNERSHLDLYALATAKDTDALLRVTQGTVYHDTLKNALTAYHISKNLTAVQSEFRNLLDAEFIKLAAGKKKKKLQDKNELGNLYKTMKDVHLLKVLYRLRRFAVSQDTRESIKNPVLTLFTQKQLEELLRAQTTQELNEAVKKTYLASIVTNAATDVYHAADEYLAAVMARTVSRSQNAGAVMFAYVFMSENEIKNIIHIIEGVRYGLPQTEILPLLSGISAAN